MIFHSLKSPTLNRLLILFSGICLFTVIAIIVFHYLLFNYFQLPVPVYNSQPSSPIDLLFIILACFSLILISASSLISSCSGVLSGAVGANSLSSQLFNQVPDYLYLPTTGDLYFNLADALIVLSSLLLLFSLINIFAVYWKS